MAWWCTFAFVVLCLLSLAALAETGVRGSPEAIHRGKQLYEQYCMYCHGENGVGEPDIPWSIRRLGYVTAMPLDETSHAWHHSDEHMSRMILQGTPRSRTRMPLWGPVFSQSQVQDLVEYLKSLWSDRILGCQGPRHMSCM